MHTLTLRLTPVLEAKLELLSRHKRVSVAAYAEELLRKGVQYQLTELPVEVAQAMETLASEAMKQSADANGTGSHEAAVVEYEAARLRFVKSRIDKLPVGGRLRIRVKSHGSFELSKEDLETDFLNVLESRAYNEAGYYHYAAIPSKAMKYRCWGRSASQLSAVNAKALEKAIQERLERDYPAERYPVEISVAYTWVHVTDYAGIDEKETVPEGVGLDRLTSVLETVKRIVGKLRQSGKLA